MKLTTAAILAFAATSALANFIPSEQTAVFAHDLHERDCAKEYLDSFDKRGGGIASSLFKSFAGASGNMGGRVASNSAQYSISRSFSSSTHSSQSTPKHPQHHSRRHRRQRLQKSIPQPHSLQERAMRRALSRPITHLESLEKRKKGKADRAPSLFKSTAGAAGNMGGRVASSSVQYGLLKAIIPPAPPPPPPLTRRALFPVATSRSSFAPVRAIKNAFSRTSQVTSRVYRKSEPARKKGKAAVISFLDGISKGITG